MTGLKSLRISQAIQQSNQLPQTVTCYDVLEVPGPQTHSFPHCHDTRAASLALPARPKRHESPHYKLMHNVSKPKANNALCTSPSLALHPRCRNKNAGRCVGNVGSGHVT
jgi:hypothetical protein